MLASSQQVGATAVVTTLMFEIMLLCHFATAVVTILQFEIMLLIF